MQQARNLISRVRQILVEARRHVAKNYYPGFVPGGQALEVLNV